MTMFARQSVGTVAAATPVAATLPIAMSVPFSSYASRACRFEIDVDPANAVVRATLSGFFTVEDARQFEHAEQAAVESLGCRSGEHRTLIDASRSEVHSREVSEVFAHMVTDAPFRARRLAVVAVATLHRMQTRRILATDRAAMFLTVEEAEAWIAADIAAGEQAAA